MARIPQPERQPLQRGQSQLRSPQMPKIPEGPMPPEARGTMQELSAMADVGRNLQQTAQTFWNVEAKSNEREARLMIQSKTRDALIEIEQMTDPAEIENYVDKTTKQIESEVSNRYGNRPGGNNVSLLSEKGLGDLEAQARKQKYKVIADRSLASGMEALEQYAREGDEQGIVYTVDEMVNDAVINHAQGQRLELQYLENIDKHAVLHELEGIESEVLWGSLTTEGDIDTKIDQLVKRVRKTGKDAPFPRLSKDSQEQLVNKVERERVQLENRHEDMKQDEERNAQAEIITELSQEHPNYENARKQLKYFDDPVDRTRLEIEIDEHQRGIKRDREEQIEKLQQENAESDIIWYETLMQSGELDPKNVRAIQRRLHSAIKNDEFPLETRRRMSSLADDLREYANLTDRERAERRNSRVGKTIEKGMHIINNQWRGTLLPTGLYLEDEQRFATKSEMYTHFDEKRQHLDDLKDRWAISWWIPGRKGPITQEEYEQRKERNEKLQGEYVENLNRIENIIKRDFLDWVIDINGEATDEEIRRKLSEIRRDVMKRSKRTKEEHIIPGPQFEGRAPIVTE